MDVRAYKKTRNCLRGVMAVKSYEETSRVT